MQLDRIVIEPRARSAWEAIDLGFVLARQWYRQLFIAWALPSALLLCILFVAMPTRWWAFNTLIAWWLKPVWDCAPLYIASRKLFGDAATLRETWRNVPRLLGSEAIAWLTWRRFSMTRAADMPVTLLEALRSAVRRKRLGVLHRNMGNAAVWLTTACANMEVIVYLGALAFALWMLPDSLDFDPFRFFYDDAATTQLIACLLTYVAAAIVAPFYTMAGFALYICRRIELEGWDIEIRFRHIAARKSSAPAALAMMLIISSGSFATPARDVADENARALEAKQSISEIVHSKDFDKQVEHWSWRWKEQKNEKDEARPIPEWFIRIVEYLEKLGGKRAFFVDAAQTIRFILGAALAMALAYLLYRYRSIVRNWLRLPEKHSDKRAPEILFGLDVRTETLPDDVPAQVLELWRSQQPRAALSLLYRATLAQLLVRFSLPFHSDYTEQECVTIVERIAPPYIAPFFCALTNNWQRLAYAHQLPQTEAIEALCAQWREVFERAH